MKFASYFPYWPVIFYGAVVLVVVGGMVALSHFLGEHHKAAGRNIPYESGIEPTGSGRLRYGIGYYLVGVFFILFDIEAAIILAWAVGFKELGWTGYILASLFILTLAAGLLYVWKLGGLNWYRSKESINENTHTR